MTAFLPSILGFPVAIDALVRATWLSGCPAGSGNQDRQESLPLVVTSSRLFSRVAGRNFWNESKASRFPQLKEVDGCGGVYSDTGMDKKSGALATTS
jgi:hypothetical protein